MRTGDIYSTPYQQLPGDGGYEVDVCRGVEASREIGGYDGEICGGWLDEVYYRYLAWSGKEMKLAGR